MKFYKKNFMEYMENNFVMDRFARELLSSIVDYGEERCNSNKEELVNFICDMVANADYIDYAEVEQFCKWNLTKIKL